MVKDADIEVLPSDGLTNDTLPAVKISFTLTAGSYATTVLRELIDYQDCTQRVIPKGSINTEQENS